MATAYAEHMLEGLGHINDIESYRNQVISNKPDTFFKEVQVDGLPNIIYLNSFGYATNEKQYFDIESTKNFLKFHKEFKEWVVDAVSKFYIKKIYVLQIQPTFFNESDKISNGFIFVKYRKDDSDFPGVALIRGNANAYLVILNVNDGKQSKYVVFSKKTQIPGLKDEYLELIAGNNLDVGGVFDKLKIINSQYTNTPKSKLVDMYPSIGGCNECVSIFQLELTIKPEEFEQLKTNTSMSVITYMDVVNKITEGNITDSKILSAFAMIKLNRCKLVGSYKGGRKKYNTRRKIRKSKKV
jgi:hypothetical protein